MCFVVLELKDKLDIGLHADRQRTESSFFFIFFFCRFAIPLMKMYRIRRSSLLTVPQCSVGYWQLLSPGHSWLTCTVDINNNKKKVQRWIINKLISCWGKVANLCHWICFFSPPPLRRRLIRMPSDSRTPRRVIWISTQRCTQRPLGMNTDWVDRALKSKDRKYAATVKAAHAWRCESRHCDSK